MRYSFCFRPFDVKNIRFAAIYRHKCDEKAENVTKSKKWDEWKKFLAKKN